MSGDPILLEVADGVATVTFNRPDRLNAFDRPVTRLFVDLLDRLDRDDAVRAIIVTGAGRAFCAGADLKAAKPFEGEDAERDFGGFITLRLFDMLKPVIFAINGPAAGMGVTMTLAGDFRLASTAAKFTLPFVRRGIAPESASAWFLQRAVGLPQALDWMLTGRTFDAKEALRGGLLRALLEPEDLLPAARAIARDIADNAAPVSVALTRQMLWRASGDDHPMQAHRIDSRAIRARSRSADAKEGLSSFLDKRPPAFPDRVSRDMPDFVPWWDEPRFE